MELDQQTDPSTDIDVSDQYCTILSSSVLCE